MSFLIQKGSGYLVVADEIARTLAYPAPVDGQQVFNKRTNLIETFHTYYGLWLNSDMVIAAEDAGAGVTQQGQVMYPLTLSPASIDGVWVVYVRQNNNASSSEKNIGVCVEVGVAGGAYFFVSLAISGSYYVNTSGVIKAGEYVEAIATGQIGVTSTLGAATFGRAINQTGDNANYLNQTLVSINNSYA
jgi:hypothetical protein